MYDEPVYMISVAAKLAGMHPQTLRIYERKKLIEPKRTQGCTRLYSQRDVDRLKLIQVLTQEFGINLAGVTKVFELQDEIEQLQCLIKQLEERAAKLQGALDEEVRNVRQSALVPMPRGSIVLRRLLEGRKR
ncbi:MAG TPA: helix-turn-helix transcriptional regulator [Anaerolineae bacterium]|jgi:MerR family transcriptional regulator/heat shock protein HspR|nr:helix-turn-helix transcriptional regulator [Anaerolineae bacterium]